MQSWLTRNVKTSERTEIGVLIQSALDIEFSAPDRVMEMALHQLVKELKDNMEWGKAYEVTLYCTRKEPYPYVKDDGKLPPPVVDYNIRGAIGELLEDHIA